MNKCKLCNFEYKTNTGGLFTRHLKSKHFINYKEYIIKTLHNGITPLCNCGYCNMVTEWTGRWFKKFVKDHDKKHYTNEQYILKHGEPKCLECGGVVKFNRVIPNRYCSTKCSGKHFGFSLITTQDKINKNVLEKYGVNRATQLQHVRDKISKSKIGQPGHPASDKQKQVAAKRLSKLWQDKDYRAATIEKAKIGCGTIVERKARSIRQKLRWQDENYIDFMLTKTIVNRLSKLHQRINKYLNLEMLGFLSEQKISRYLVDELNEKYKVIIEINGDYVHANPKKFLATDIIKMPGNSYTAFEKWESDKRKIDKLKKLGYKVIVIWESDDLEEKSNYIKQLCER